MMKQKMKLTLSAAIIAATLMMMTLVTTEPMHNHKVKVEAHVLQVSL